VSEMPRVLTVEQAASWLAISRSAAYRAVRTGELPSLRVGKRILVPRGRLLELLGETVETNGGSDNGGEPRRVSDQGRRAGP
jgi:excisionase family DNA binding protein